MNIDDIKFCDLKKIAEIFKGSQGSIPDLTGKYAIVRTRNEGVNAGEIVGNGIGWVQLKGARRMWRIISPVESEKWYEGVAIHGVGDGSRLSGAVDKLIVEDYSITICSKKGEESIKNAKTED